MLSIFCSVNFFKADRWGNFLPPQTRCVSYKYFELLLKQVTDYTWKFLSVTLLIPACDWNKHSSIPWQSVMITPTLNLVIDNSRKTTWTMSTLKTGEVPKDIFHLPDIPVLMHSWTAASLELQFFIFILLIPAIWSFSHTYPAHWPKYTAGSWSVCQI